MRARGSGGPGRADRLLGGEAGGPRRGRRPRARASGTDTDVIWTPQLLKRFSIGARRVHGSEEERILYRWGRSSIERMN